MVCFSMIKTDLGCAVWVSTKSSIIYCFKWLVVFYESVSKTVQDGVKDHHRKQWLSTVVQKSQLCCRPFLPLLCMHTTHRKENIVKFSSQIIGVNIFSLYMQAMFDDAGNTKMILITLVFCCSTLCHTGFWEHGVMERNFAVN